MTPYRIVAAGDSVIVVEFEERIDPIVNDRTIACAGALQRAAISGVRDVVPTYRSVAIYFDPLRTNGAALMARAEVVARAVSSRSSDSPEAIRSPAAPSPTVRIPVCYGDELGPDLADLAAFAHMDETEVVRTHVASTYRVFMVGFVPGFAYLGVVDERIAMPRRASPRLRVPAGSVAVGGVQTGVYPMETPGGWQVIGRTPVKPFDPGRADPFLMKAGDAVEFYPIERGEFDTWAN
ncbi:MAG TPA: 5-oxoprolinase subunit PxpB [Vicinamibacterales bacterium]